MTSERWIVIPRWEEFQHRDAARATVPTWIKDMTQQLSKDEYLSLTWPQRGLLHDIRLEYARSKRQLRADTTSLSRRLGQTVRPAQLAALNHAGFIEISASRPASEHASNPASLEVEERREEQTLNPPDPPLTSLALVPREPGDLEPQTAPWRVVFDHWRSARVKPRSEPTPKRQKYINGRLKRFTVAELCRAIDGIAFDPWHERHLHDDLVTVFRDDENVEKYLELEARRPSARTANGAQTADDMIRQLAQEMN